MHTKAAFMNKLREQYGSNIRDFYTARNLRLHDRANWYGVQYELREFVAAFWRELKVQGFPMYCHTALRTNEEQAALFDKGHSTIRADGAHQRGCAVDIVHATEHWNPSREFWDHIGITGLEVATRHNINITWGGGWKSFYDPAHWELAYWRDIPTVKARTQDIIRAAPIGVRSAMPEDPFYGHDDLEKRMKF